MGDYDGILKNDDGSFDSVADVVESLGGFIENLGISDDEQSDLADLIAHYCELREKMTVATILENAGASVGISWRTTPNECEAQRERRRARLLHLLEAQISAGRLTMETARIFLDSFRTSQGWRRKLLHGRRSPERS